MILQGNYGNFTIPIPEGYEVVSTGSIILDGDLLLAGGIDFYPEQNLIEWKPFMNADLVQRTVSSEMVIIRSIP